MASQLWTIIINTTADPPPGAAFVATSDSPWDAILYSICAESQPADHEGFSWQLGDAPAAASAAGRTLDTYNPANNPDCGGLVCGGYFFGDRSVRRRHEMKIKRGSTSVIWPVFIADAGDTRYVGKTGLAYGDVTIKYIRAGDSSATTVTPVTMTIGTWASGGFKEVTGMAGWYEVGIPDACFADSRAVAIMILPTAGTGIPVSLLAEIDSVDYQDGEAFGLNDLKRSVGRGTIAASSTTTSLNTTGLNPAATVTDQFKGRAVIFDRDTTTTALRCQGAEITASNTSGNLTVTALTTTPAAGDTFLIV